MRSAFLSGFCTVRLRAGFLAATIALLATTTACENEDAVLGAVPGIPPGAMVSLSRDIQPIFTTNCATSLCHVTNSPLGAPMSLEAGKTFDENVGRPSIEVPSLQRIEPGSSNLSYLVLKIEGDPSILGDPMPQGAPPLDATVILLIRQWIDEGARNN